jgi:hypothetical protein
MTGFAQIDRKRIGDYREDRIFPIFLMPFPKEEYAPMKNPFKDAGKKFKAFAEKHKASRAAKKLNHKPGAAKRVVDGFGDSCFVGGFTLLGTAAFAPVGTVPAVIAGSIFLAVGGTAKFAASRMKGAGPELETALPPLPPAPAEEEKPAPMSKPACPDFTRAVTNDNTDKAVQKRPPLPPAAPRQQP